MKKMLVVFRKELRETLRDRRTLLVNVIIPLAAIPLLLTIATKISASQQAKAETRILRIALFFQGNARPLQAILAEKRDFAIQEASSAEEIERMILSGHTDFGISAAADFDDRVAEQKNGLLQLYFKSSSEIRIAKERVLALIKEYEKRIVDQRLEKNRLPPDFIRAVDVSERDLATVKERIGEAIGGFLPYIFVLFCFLGSMYPAIDLGAGEKERGTLEPLLCAPVSRGQIVAGKFLLISFAGILSAVFSMLGLYMAIRQFREIPPELLAALLRIVELKSILLVFSLLLPLSMFFAAVLLAISIYARSFKEGQNYITPLSFVIIFPVFIGLLPGFKLTAGTALVPVLNVSLATREIIAGTIQPLPLAATYFSLITMAGLALWFCSWWFNRESTLFR